MNDQTNPEEILDGPEAATPVAESTEAPVAPEAPAKPPVVTMDDDDDDDEVSVDYDEDDVPPAADDDGDDFDEDEEEDDEVEGPSQFQPTQRGTMDRRGGFRARRQLRNETRIEDISYKNIEMLSKFVDPRGRILSRRKTKISAKMQRRITTAIKRARHLALLPYTADHIRITRTGR